MFHAATAPLCHFSPLHSGDQMFILPRFELESFLRNIERHQITEGAFVPPMVHMILASPLREKYSLKSIRHAHAGAAPLDAGSQERFRQLLADDAPLTQVWGMTETSCTCSSLPHEYGNETTGSVGKMLPNMDVKLCDDDGNDITADDVRGELCVRGPLVFQGYYLNPEANARDLDEDGFFHTGDVACECRPVSRRVRGEPLTGRVADRSSESKLWYIVDRKKELIKVRGFQVSPSEIEGVLLTHPDIIDAAVIGITAQKKSDGEEPRAYITLRQGSTLDASGVQDLLKERLTRYKHCTGGIVIGKEIPKSMSGKKLKRLLVEQANHEVAVERRQAKM
jgi:4-coumarate--CoA ligase